MTRAVCAVLILTLMGGLCNDEPCPKGYSDPFDRTFPNCSSFQNLFSAEPTETKQESCHNTDSRAGSCNFSKGMCNYTHLCGLQEWKLHKKGSVWVQPSGGPQDSFILQSPELDVQYPSCLTYNVSVTQLLMRVLVDTASGTCVPKQPNVTGGHVPTGPKTHQLELPIHSHRVMFKAVGNGNRKLAHIFSINISPGCCQVPDWLAFMSETEDNQSSLCKWSGRDQWTKSSDDREMTQMEGSLTTPALPPTSPGTIYCVTFNYSLPVDGTWFLKVYVVDALKNMTKLRWHVQSLNQTSERNYTLGQLPVSAICASAYRVQVRFTAKKNSTTSTITFHNMTFTIENEGDCPVIPPHADDNLDDDLGVKKEEDKPDSTTPIVIAGGIAGLIAVTVWVGLACRAVSRKRKVARDSDIQLLPPATPSDNMGMVRPLSTNHYVEVNMTLQADVGPISGAAYDENIAPYAVTGGRSVVPNVQPGCSGIYNHLNLHGKPPAATHNQAKQDNYSHVETHSQPQSLRGAQNLDSTGISLNRQAPNVYHELEPVGLSRPDLEASGASADYNTLREIQGKKKAPESDATPKIYDRIGQSKEDIYDKAQRPQRKDIIGSNYHRVDQFKTSS